MTKNVVLHCLSVHNLALGARLAAFGNTVAIHDCPNSFTRDHEPTPIAPLTLPAAWRDLFFKTGADFEALVQLEPVAEISVQGFALPPVGVGAWLRAIEQHFGPAAAEQAQQLLDLAAEIWQSEYRDIYLSDQLGTPVAYDQSWEAALALIVKDNRLREVFAALIASSASTHDIRAITIPYLLANFGGWTRGTPDVVGVLRAHVERLGVHLIDACSSADCVVDPLADFPWGSGWHYELLVAERIARTLQANSAN